MGRTPRCSKDGLNKGAWTSDEDKILTDHIKIHGEGKWSNVAKETGLRRCGKSCRLRWMNYLRPDIKRGNISHDEEELIIRLHKLLGNRWSLIAGRLPGRTDNEIKNYWNTNLSKKSSDQPPVHVINNAEKRLKPRTVNVTDNEQPSSSFDKSKANSLPAAGENNVFFTSGDAGNHKNNINVLEQPPYVDGKWVKNTTYETEYSSDIGSPSSMSREDNSSDFMMDFNMDDFCKILDSDFTKFSEIHVNHLVEGDGKGDQPSLFPAKMEENWRDITTTEGVQTDMGTSEFLSLASSFLESAEEWPGDDLNITHHHVD